MHVYMSEYSITLQSYLLYQIIKKIIRQPEIEKSVSQTFKNIKSERKYHIRRNMNQVRTNRNFAIKHNPQTYLNNDEYNNPKFETCMFRPLHTQCTISIYLTYVVKKQAMCSTSCCQPGNGLIVTHALGQMTYNLAGRAHWLPFWLDTYISKSINLCLSLYSDS